MSHFFILEVPRDNFKIVFLTIIFLFSGLMEQTELLFIFSLKKSVGNCSSFCNTYHLPFTMHELLDCRISEKVSNPPPCDVCSVLALFMVLCRLYSYL